MEQISSDDVPDNLNLALNFRGEGKASYIVQTSVSVSIYLNIYLVLHLASHSF